jgi:hypothetical protein
LKTKPEKYFLKQKRVLCNMFECKRQKAQYPYREKKGYCAFWKRKKGTVQHGTPKKGYCDISL